MHVLSKVNAFYLKHNESSQKDREHLSANTYVLYYLVVICIKVKGRPLDMNRVSDPP